MRHHLKQGSEQKSLYKKNIYWPVTVYSFIYIIYCIYILYKCVCVCEKLEKYGLKEELVKMWKVEATAVPPVIRALGAVTPRLGGWLRQIPGTAPEISVQKSAVPGRSKTLSRTFILSLL